MGNALGHSEGTNSTWASGVATFVVKKEKIKAVVISRKGEKSTFILSKDLLPEQPKNLLKKIKQAGKEEKYGVSFRVDEDGDVEEIQCLYPANWMGIPMKLVGISDPTGEREPAPVDLPIPGSTTETYPVWFAYLRIVSGEWKGAIVPYFLNYKFEARGDGFTRFQGNPDNPNATRVRQCIDFCVYLQAAGDDIEWPDDGNVLPTILARALNAGVILNTSGKNGDMETVLPLEGELDDSDDDSENPFNGDDNDEVDGWDAD